jgi:tRNA (guanine-N7-)-methyltransferase
VDNPARTAEYRAKLIERRETLRAEMAAILPKGGPFVLEVGAGHGHFLTAFAEANPGRVCVGIDLEQDRVTRSLRKRDRAKLQNLHFLRGDAAMLLEVLPAAAAADLIFVLFPDPWPKLRHHKHRIMRPRFLANLAAKSLPGAILCFRTDFRPYFAEVEATLRTDPEWQLDPAAAWPFELPTVFQERAESYHSLIARRR